MKALLLLVSAAPICVSFTPPRFRGLIRRRIQAVADLSDVVVNYGLTSPSSPEITAWFAKEPSGTELQVSSCTTLPGALAQMWAAVAGPPGVPDSSKVILFPDCSVLSKPGMLAGLVDHLETCKDVCDSFGSSVIPLAVDPKAPPGHPAQGPVPGIRLKFFRGSQLFSTDGDDGWDDWGDLDDDLHASLGEDAGGTTMEGASRRDLERLHAVPADDGSVVEVSKAWVKAVVADMGICPFTTSASKAGLPLGQVHYPVSRAETPESIYAAYWHEVALLESAPERALSTTLLVTPLFGLVNPEAFMALSDTLTKPLESLELETVRSAPALVYICTR